MLVHVSSCCQVTVHKSSVMCATKLAEVLLSEGLVNVLILVHYTIYCDTAIMPFMCEVGLC